MNHHFVIESQLNQIKYYQIYQLNCQKLLRLVHLIDIYKQHQFNFIAT